MGGLITNEESTGRFLFRDATVSDIAEMARIHGNVFAGYFLSRLGPRFVREYYRAIVEFDGGIALLLMDARGSIAGMATGFIDPKKFYRKFRRRAVSMMPRIALAILADIRLLNRVLANVIRLGRGGTYLASDQREVELSSLAVAEEWRGKGGGYYLLWRFIDEAERLGGSRVVLSTDALNNDDVNSFYRRSGFARISEVRSGQRTLNIWSLNLDKVREPNRE